MGNSPSSNGFGKKTTAEETVKDVDLHGKNVVITGANSGIGLESARVLANRGATVYMACRNPDKAKAAYETIKAQNADADIHLMQLDLASLQSVRKFAEEFNELNIPLHILLNNAGIMASLYDETVDGIEKQLGTNHIGHFLLTNLLLPRLKEGQPSRIVNVSSTAHDMNGVNFNDISGKGTWNTGHVGKWRAYAQSKTANILFTVELDRRFKEEGLNITANCLHPGVIETNLAGNLSGFEQFMFKITPSFFLKTIPQGAATSVYLCANPSVEVSGRYFSDCNVAPAKPYATNPKFAQKLWEISEKLIADADARRENKAQENDDDKPQEHEHEKEDEVAEKVDEVEEKVADAAAAVEVKRREVAEKAEEVAEAVAEKKDEIVEKVEEALEDNKEEDE